MAELTLDVARKILDAAIAKGVEKKLKPLVITVLDARGCVKGTPVVCPVNQVCGEGVGCHGTDTLKKFSPDAAEPKP